MQCKPAHFSKIPALKINHLCRLLFANCESEANARQGLMTSQTSEHSFPANYP